MKRLVGSVAILALAFLAQYWLAQRTPDQDTTIEAAALFAIAALLFVALFRTGAEPYVVGAARPLAAPSLRHASFLTGALAIALATAAAPRFITAQPTPWGWSLHLASVLAIVVAALLQERALRPPAPAEGAGAPSFTRRTRRRIGAGLLLLLLAAALLRFYKLGALPEGIWYDEAINALVARNILADPAHRPFYLYATYHTAHFNYLVALAFNFLGESIGGARLISALLGVGMVGAGWLTAWELFVTRPAHGQRSLVPLTMAFLFAAVLAFAAWSLNFSRIAVNYSATPFFALLASGFLLRGLRTQRIAHYMIAGLALAGGLHFYSSFRLFLPVLPLFVLALLIQQRDAWGKSWRGLLVLVMVALVVATPLLTFAATNRDEFFERSANTFLLRDAEPAQRVPLLLENTRKHLLMFNVEGDNNGRHNLPKRPMLDPWLGAFFVLGVALSLWRWRHPIHLLLLLWLIFCLLGGILTLDFEAPQSLRANGAMPAAFLLALVPVAEILRHWERGEHGRMLPAFLPALAVVAFVPIVVWQSYAFFFVQARDFAVWNAFSTGETLLARILARYAPDESEAWIISYFAQREREHPVVRFLAPQWQDKTNTLLAQDAMPLPWRGDKQVFVFLDDDTRVPFQSLQRFYPDATFAEFGMAEAGTATSATTGALASERVSMRMAQLSSADVASVQGLDARYYANASWSGEPAFTARAPQLDFDWQAEPPLPLPFSAEWEGVLRVPAFGDYTLHLRAPAAAELWLDETHILSGTGQLESTLQLAVGNHRLRVRAQGAAGAVQLSWQLPGQGATPIPTANLFAAPVSANGLYGAYHANDNWQGAIAHAAIDPQINLIYHRTPLTRPFSVEWSGKIVIPLSGDYAFAANAIDAVELYIDGELILAALQPNVNTEVTLPLGEGLHDIRVRFVTRGPFSRVNLYWAPPGGERTPIPSAALLPPLGSHERIALPSAAELGIPLQDAAGAPVAPALQGLGALQATTTTVIASGLSNPLGIATTTDTADTQHIYVADRGSQRVLMLAPDGALQRTLIAGGAPFVEPFDIAVGSDGTLYVLDAGAATVELFSPVGDYLRTLTPDRTILDRARGLHVDARGHLWIASTPGQRIVELDAEGALIRAFPAWPDADAQVVDVVTTADGAIFATVLGVNKLVRYDAEGNRLFALDLPPANTVDGPHLAADVPGNIYVTHPEESRIVHYTPTGEALGYWQLPAQPARPKPLGIALDGQGRIWFTDSANLSAGFVDAQVRLPAPIDIAD